MKVSRRTLRWVIISMTNGHENLPTAHTTAMDEIRNEISDRVADFDSMLDQHEDAQEFELLPVPPPPRPSVDAPETTTENLTAAEEQALPASVPVASEVN